MSTTQGDIPGTSQTAPVNAKRPLKRKADSLKDDKSKKKKRKNVKRTVRPNYTIQEGEDMLLIISNISSGDSIWKPKRKGCKKKKVNKKGRSKTSANKTKKAPVKVPKVTEGTIDTNVDLEAVNSVSLDHWGQSLPMEVLVKIFQFAIHQDGAVPFLCRVGRVCHLWNGAASSPVLWRNVSIGYCWIEPGKTQLPGTEQKIRNTIDWLAENRLSQLREFSLCHWKKHVDYVIQKVSQSCHNLHSLKLSYCTGMTETAFQSLGADCRSLENINVQHSEFNVDGLVSFLEAYGNQIKKIYFTHSTKSDKLLSVLSKGCCPELRLLEINTKLDGGYCQLPICIQALQIGCPKLQTFRLMNVTPVPKMIRNTPSSTSGFPMLEELCIATSSHSFMTDSDLNNVLHGSPHLRVLDLRGASRITATGLYALPFEKLECLYWGLYFSSNTMVASKKGIHMLAQKWSSTLRELDLANQPFSEEDMEIAMGYLAHAAGVDLFRSLNLSGTKITSSSLRLLITQAPALKYLNLSSCRYLPRGLKRVYHGQEDIQLLLDKLG
ncbi:F-box/LRR-repeat protein 6 [Pimephales promelas]|uniref:F-box/LRR-repeat protein 6 n=1 Tax=Pimephales promelas TaxID=90988 RepID=UPI0019556B4A|nr:F-box/LRR-repeat protein 6 [Pimephales promelas]KAG1948746.1 F-box/LRR-repeat protein [Pimephales promelas]KAG1948747.1 F-box/LRR-repeat protein [Pimephales promelas]